MDSHRNKHSQEPTLLATLHQSFSQGARPRHQVMPEARVEANTSELARANVRLVRELIERLKEGAAALAETRERYTQLGDALTEYLYTLSISHDGLIRETSHEPACIGVTGYTPEEFGADPLLWQRIIHEEDRAKVDGYREQILAGGAPLPMEHRIIRKDGAVIWVRNTLLPRYDASAILLSCDGIMSDISERMAIEQQLYHSLKMEALGRLAGGVVHDFNNCLCGIMGFCELSMMSVSPEGPLYYNLEKIYESAKTAAGITRQLLAFSRKQVVEPKVLNLNEIVTTLTGMMRRLMGEEIELITTLASDLGLIKADPSQIEQILINLAVNARDAMPLGGTLRIETVNEKKEQGQADANPDHSAEEYVTLTVSDSGIGMPDHVRDHIFEPFFTTKELGKGTGLGLSTVYCIVKENRGRISVQSGEGKGTEFVISLPRDEGRFAGNGREQMSPCEMAKGRATILIVEDDPMIRHTTADILQRYGYQVVAACDGEEALALAGREESAIDLILTDVIMPRMSGPQFVDRLKEMGKECKALFMSGDLATITLRHEEQAGSVNFIGKPFGALELTRKIDEMLHEL